MSAGSPVLVVASRRSVDEVAGALPAAAAARGFGVLGGYDLRQRLADKGLALGRAVRVFDVCSPPHAKRVLDAAPAISAVLPCRISVFEDGGWTKLATMRPIALASLFAEPALAPVAEEVDRAIEAIMRDAAGEPA